MKYILIFSLMVAFGSQAQNENKKRPSWSQGLPERQTTPKPTDPTFKPESAQDEPIADFDVAEIDQPVTPELEMELTTEPIIVPEPIVQTDLDPANTIALSREQVREQYYNGQANQENNETTNALVASYQWKVVKTLPIEIPGDFNEQLKLNIHINPKGKVLKVTKADPSMPSDVLRRAGQSIKQWRFEPPADIGIEENISKIFVIDVQTDA